MFQRIKNNYRIVAECKNGDKLGRYTFIVDYDDDWGEIAAKMFFDEFGIKPTSIHMVSREKL